MKKMQWAHMKKEAVVSTLLVLAFLSFVNLFMFNPTVKAQPSEPTVIGSTDVFGHSYQRYAFYANARFWVFYSDNANLVYTTSTDGSTWSSATTVRNASMCPEFSVWFDGTYVHYAKGQRDPVSNTSLYYRMGVPSANGTITWNAIEQIVAPAVENRSYRVPQIITDSDGYPVITYLNRTTGGPSAWAVSVSKSSTKNGTWTNAPGFPVVVSTDQAWPFSVPLANGKLYTMWSLDHGKIKGALYNGAFWGSAANCTSNFVGEDQRGLCAVAYGDDVHLVYIGNETATKIYRYVKRTYGSGWGSETVVKNVTGASGDLESISLTLDPSNGDLWMWFNTTDDKIAYRKYVASTSSWDTSDTYPFADVFTSPYYITASYQVRNNKIPTYWQEGTATPYDLVFDYFNVDTVPPNIEILSPENKTYTLGDVPLTFTVDESTSWIGYSLDGQTNVTITGNTTLTGLLDGMHYVVVYANDTAGNMGASSTVYFTVDTTSPTISILSPENKTYTLGDVPLTFTVDESTSWIGYSLDGQTNVTITGNTILVGLSDGTHTITVYANDTVGNMGHSDIVYFTVDTAPPNIVILSPENKKYSTSSVLLSFTVNETTSWIGYSLDGQANLTITANTTLTGLSDGSHSLIVYAIDTAGNIGSSDTVYFTIDTTPPSIPILSPENKTYDTTDIPLNYTIDESVSWMAYSLDGQANVTITGNTTLTGLSDRSHSLIVYARDTVGNTGASETIYFTVSTPPPEPFPTWAIATIVIIAIVGAALLIYFTKVKKKTEQSK